MAKKQNKVREVSIKESGGAFSFFKSSGNTGNSDYDFKSLASIRQVLSNEKARLLNVIKNQQPGSIYRLARILGRDFKSVNDDVKLLEKLGFVDLVKEKSKNRTRYRPEIVVDTLTINLKI